MEHIVNSGPYEVTSEKNILMSKQPRLHLQPVLVFTESSDITFISGAAYYIKVWRPHFPPP